MSEEIFLRKKEINNEIIETIYFGGGTPSLCTTTEIELLIKTIYTNFQVTENPEITLEANPDDLTEEKIKQLSKTKINRLSIGVQSFFEEDLQLMNRAHNVNEALQCIEISKKYFDNVSIDLIYGIPGMSNERWTQNLETALQLNVPHISSYALTVEDNTALKKMIKNGTVMSIDDASAEAHYRILVEKLEGAGFINYEFSNFGKPGFFSKNNTAYWNGKSYLGIGPSAHSYNGKQRSWNIANNSLYLKGVKGNKRNFEVEILSQNDRFNEYIMTRLRTIEGVSLSEIKKEFGEFYFKHLCKKMEVLVGKNLLKLDKNVISITKKGKFLADGIASDLFFLN